MWDRVKFVIENLKTINFLVVLVMIFFVLIGWLDINQTCRAECRELIKAINPLSAAQADQSFEIETGKPGAPLQINIDWFPKRSR